jgi:hypothetical protein
MVPGLIVQNQNLASLRVGAKALPKDARLFEIRGLTLGGGSRGTEVGDAGGNAGFDIAGRLPCAGRGAPQHTPEVGGRS